MYYRHAKEASAMSDWGHAMFVDHKDAWIDGGINYIYDGKDSVDISELEDTLKAAWNESLESGDFDDMYMADITAEEAFASFSPEDIIMSAQAWDNEDMVQWIWEKVLEPNSIYAVTTPDGAVVFDENLIEKVK